MDAQSFYSGIPHHSNGVIRAELIGSYWCWCHGLKTQSPSPVLAMARALVAAGCDPRLRLEVYRGHSPPCKFAPGLSVPGEHL